MAKPRIHSWEYLLLITVSVSGYCVNVLLEKHLKGAVVRLVLTTNKDYLEPKGE